MNTNQNATKTSRFRTFVRYAWSDQVRANRALLRIQPHEEYLFNHRGR